MVLNNSPARCPVLPVLPEINALQSAMRGKSKEYIALAEKAGQIAAEEAKPISDVRSSADYRRAMVGTMTKRALQSGYGAWDACAVELERLYLDKLMKTEDARDGITAFLNKQKPVFKGR